MLRSTVRISSKAGRLYEGTDNTIVCTLRNTNGMVEDYEGYNHDICQLRGGVIFSM